MPDLTPLQGTEATRIVGASATGEEQTPVGSSLNREILAADVANNGGVNANLAVGTSAVEVKVGGARLANRKYIHVQPQDVGIYMGYSSSVTTANGIELFKSQLLIFPAGENTEVWLIATGAGKNARIAEVA